MKLDWRKMNGMIPAVVQHVRTGQVLMLGYMDEAALAQTEETKRVTFYSRSREKIWVKGETSGNFLDVVEVTADCDGDSLLIKALPAGPTCHRGTTSCYGDDLAPGIGFLGELETIIEARREASPETSYTAKLFQRGLDRMAQKVGEEGVEVVIAAKNEDKEPLKGEAADLIFHLMVLLKARGFSLTEIVDELRRRHLSKP